MSSILNSLAATSIAAASSKRQSAENDPLAITIDQAFARYWNEVGKVRAGTLSSALSAQCAWQRSMTIAWASW